MKILMQGTSHLVLFCDACEKEIEDLNYAYYAYESKVFEDLKEVYFCHQHNRCPEVIEAKIREQAREAGKDPDKVYVNWCPFATFGRMVLHIWPKEKKAPFSFKNY